MATSSATLRRRLPVVDAEVLEALPPARWRPPEELVGPRDDEIFAARPPAAHNPVQRRWLTSAVALGALATYPAMVVAASSIGESRPVESERGQWTLAWAGAAVDLLQPQYQTHGWASDAPEWSPMARLTAKPAFQSALAETVGEFLALKAGPDGTGDAGRGDLAAAVRLLDADSTGVQLRAAVDALRSHDDRRRRLGAPDDGRGPMALATLNLVDDWAEVSKLDLAEVAATASGSPLDRTATEAVYAAKARARSALAFVSTLDWPEDPDVRTARTEALDAWRAAAEFHPLLVFNASPEATFFGNHPSAMGFLVERAQAATHDYAVALSAADLDRSGG
jgi:hypothetical protein